MSAWPAAPPFRRRDGGGDAVGTPVRRAALLLPRAALDPVLGRALAKNKEDRYATCGELVAAAQAALAPGAPGRRRRRRPLGAGRRRRRARRARGDHGGGAVASLRRRREAPPRMCRRRPRRRGAPTPPARAGYGAVHRSRRSRRAASPSAVRILGARHRRPRPCTPHRPAHQRRSRGTSPRIRFHPSSPAAVAAGAWSPCRVGNSRLIGGANSMVSVSRVDPADDDHHKHRPAAPNADQGGNGFSAGRAQIVVGDGAVLGGRFGRHGGADRPAQRARGSRTSPSTRAWLAPPRPRGRVGPVRRRDRSPRIDPVRNRVGQANPAPLR